MRNDEQSMLENLVDKDTKRVYERLTPKGVLAHYPYFYQKMVHPTTDELLCIMNFEGIRNLYLLNINDGEWKQITDFSKEDDFPDYGPQFTEGYEGIVYVVNNQVLRHDLKTTQTKIIYTPQKGWDTYSVPALSTDGRYMATVDFWSEDYINKNNDSWDTFKEQSKRGLRSKLVRVDLQTSEKEVVIDTGDYEQYGLKKNQWLGHPQFKPHSNNVISYCHEGYGGTVDARIWLVDCQNIQPECPREHAYQGEIISHEFFTPDGKHIGFVRIENDESNKGSLRTVDCETFEESIVMDLPRCSHFMSDPSGRYMIADADYPAEPYLHFIDTVKKIQIPLLKHQSSMASYGNTQDAHPHPFFSPNGRRIFFVSDMEGCPSIYKVDISDLIEEDKGL